MKYSNTKEFIKDWKSKTHERYQGGLDFLKYVGPGLIVTVGFIDPGNWATNFAAGGQFGYSLLWVITLSTIVMIVLQHNAAHLGIVSGRCLSEAANEYFPKKVSRPLLLSAVAASISTSLAEILDKLLQVHREDNHQPGLAYRTGVSLRSVYHRCRLGAGGIPFCHAVHS